MAKRKRKRQREIKAAYMRECKAAKEKVGGTLRVASPRLAIARFIAAYKQAGEDLPKQNATTNPNSRKNDPLPRPLSNNSQRSTITGNLSTHVACAANLINDLPSSLALDALAHLQTTWSRFPQVINLIKSRINTIKQRKQHECIRRPRAGQTESEWCAENVCVTDNKKAGRTFVLPTKQVDSSGGGRQPVCKAVFSAFYQLLQQNIKLIYSKENGLGLVATTTIRRGTYVHGVCDPRIEKHGYTVQVNTNTRATVLGPFSFVNYGCAKCRNVRLQRVNPTSDGGVYKIRCEVRKDVPSGTQLLVGYGSSYGTKFTCAACQERSPLVIAG